MIISNGILLYSDGLWWSSPLVFYFILIVIDYLQWYFTLFWWSLMIISSGLLLHSDIWLSFKVCASASHSLLLLIDGLWLSPMIFYLFLIVFDYLLKSLLLLVILYTIHLFLIIVFNYNNIKHLDFFCKSLFLPRFVYTVYFFRIFKNYFFYRVCIWTKRFLSKMLKILLSLFDLLMSSLASVVRNLKVIFTVNPQLKVIIFIIQNC